MALIRKKLEIKNKLGLHARAAAKFVGIACAYTSRIRLGTPKKMIDGKSIMAVMMLAASKGSTLTLEINGEDAKDAMQALVTLVNNRFHEEE